MAVGDSKVILGKRQRNIGFDEQISQKISLIFPLWLILQITAFWSVWRWYFLRLSTSNEEIYGVLAIIGIIMISFKAKSQSPQNKSLIFSIALILLYAITYPLLPPLLRAVIAVTSLTFFLSGWRFGKTFNVGVWALFLLSLPIVASLQFYLGFPLRVIVGEATTFLLKLNGFVVFREGVCLHFGEKLIWIDAPCSGIKMLWAGFFLTALLITIYRFNLAKSVLAFAIALGIILVGNIFRSTGLFYLEAEIVKLPSFAHDAMGVVAFILTCVGIVLVILRIKQPINSDKAELRQREVPRFQIIFFLLSCVLAFSIPFFVSGKTPLKKSETTATFPAMFEGKPLTQLELTEREQFFLNDFPGEIKRFTDGEREIIIRFVTQTTRKLHPSSDCFSAIGYQIKPLPLKIDEKENKWACFSAKKDGENLKVCERIYTDSGENWTDVSSWYWSALSGVNSEGYWAFTVAETQSE